MPGDESTPVRKSIGSRRVAYVVTTIDEVAEFFGVGIDAVKLWRKGGMPGRAKGGRWDLSRIAQWRLGIAREMAQTGCDDEQHLRLMREAKLKREQANAELVRIKAEQAAGRLLDRQDVDLGYQERTRAFVSVLNRIPSELVPKVCGIALADAQGIAQAWVKAQRAAMSG